MNSLSCFDLGSNTHLRYLRSQAGNQFVQGPQAEDFPGHGFQLLMLGLLHVNEAPV